MVNLKSIVLVGLLLFVGMIPVQYIEASHPEKIIIIQKVQQGDGWLPENFSQDMIQEFIEAFWKDDGTGVINRVLCLAPIFGTCEGASQLLFPLFLLLMSGIYFKLRKSGMAR